MTRRSRRNCLLATIGLVGTLLGACTSDSSPAGDDQFGGFSSIETDASGRFRIEQIDGVWWFVDPLGNAFFSTGVNNVNPAGDHAPALGRSPYLDAIRRRYGSPEGWADATRDRLREWGFNTIGAFSLPHVFDDPMPYTVALQFSTLAPLVPDIPGRTATRDYLGPWFEVAARSYAAEQARGCAQDPFCIGVFTDNEPVWARTPSHPVPYLHAYTELPAGAWAKVEVQAILTDRYDDDVSRFNDIWGTTLRTFDDYQDLRALPGRPAAQSRAQRADDHAVRDRVIERYFEVTHDALRDVSDELLILGARLPTVSTPGSVYELAGPYVDVMSINSYEVMPADRGRAFDEDLVMFADDPWSDLEAVWDLSGKPILIGEFGYRAVVPDGPQGTVPSGFPRLRNQTERADRYRAYIEEVHARPYVVGAHWFQYMDQPATGRSDGQDSNWGLVDIRDEPWPELVEAIASASRALPEARGTG